MTKNNIASARKGKLSTCEPSYKKCMEKREKCTINFFPRR